MANFFSPEAEMVLLGNPDDLNNLYASTMSQTPPSLVYSPVPQQMSLGVEHPGSSHIYQQSDYRPMVSSSPYPPHSYWTSQPPPTTHYSTYPPLSHPLPSVSLSPEQSFLPEPSAGTRQSRSHSGSSSIGGLGIPSSTMVERAPHSLSRSVSPSSPDLRAYGYPNKNGTWSCAYPGCNSRAVFTRGCDLRKHHKRHTKSLFCHHEGCPQSTGGGFSSKKDLARHEAKHNPGVLCDWDGCDRVFSRVDNMVRFFFLHISVMFGTCMFANISRRGTTSKGST